MKYKNHKYTRLKRNDTVYHSWELISTHGGISFHVSFYREDPSCGLERHSIYPRGEDAPDHVNCPLTGGRCWHDGTSLYAREHLWPNISSYLQINDHESIFRILEREAEELKPRNE